MPLVHLTVPFHLPAVPCCCLPPPPLTYIAPRHSYRYAPYHLCVCLPWYYCPFHLGLLTPARCYRACRTRLRLQRHHYIPRCCYRGTGFTALPWLLDVTATCRHTRLPPLPCAGYTGLPAAHTRVRRFMDRTCRTARFLLRMLLPDCSDTILPRLPMLPFGLPAAVPFACYHYRISFVYLPGRDRYRLLPPCAFTFTTSTIATCWTYLDMHHPYHHPAAIYLFAARMAPVTSSTVNAPFPACNTTTCTPLTPCAWWILYALRFALHCCLYCHCGFMPHYAVSLPQYPPCCSVACLLSFTSPHLPFSHYLGPAVHDAFVTCATRHPARAVDAPFNTTVCVLLPVTHGLAFCGSVLPACAAATTPCLPFSALCATCWFFTPAPFCPNFLAMIWTWFCHNAASTLLLRTMVSDHCRCSYCFLVLPALQF